MNGLELMQKSKETLNNEIPIFNFITNELAPQEIINLVNIDDNKINAIISEKQKENGIINVLEEYKKFKET